MSQRFLLVAKNQPARMQSGRLLGLPRDERFIDLSVINDNGVGWVTLR
jgi:hypothetical protein